MTEKTSNKWFNVFILAGMTIATCIVTSIRVSGSQGSAEVAWLLLAALGSLMGVLATVCSANGWIVTFLFGFFDVFIYGVVCYHKWILEDTGLTNTILHFAYFVPMQFVGYLQWRKRGGKSKEKVHARRLRKRGRWMWLGITTVATAVLFFVSLYIGDSETASVMRYVAVFLEAISVICNIIGQYLMSTAYMEQWIFWLAVNISTIGWWLLSDEQYAAVYLVKYSFYLINALNGLRIWLKLSRPEAK